MPDREKNLLTKIKSRKNIPRHIAIIMDGNGRWAKQRKLPRVAGHREGINSVRDVVEGCGELGIEVVTLYTFSTENWRRPKEEVSALMKLLLHTLRKEIDDLMKNNVRLMTIGDICRLPRDAADSIFEAIERTKNNSGLILNLALNYGGREEIVYAVRKIGDQIREGKINPETIDQEIVQSQLFTSALPDPDLLIRTSGELRISNFLLWQLAYTEIYITDVLWPDFRRQHLFKAVDDYLNRERRFGRVSEQVNRDKDIQNK